MYEITDTKSSLIESISYDEDTWELTIRFKKYYIDEETYVDFPLKLFMSFASASSLGKYYLHGIKPNFKTKHKKNMADKIIKLKINTKDIKKEWLFVGEKGVYLNVTLLYNEKQNDKGQNGMIVQDVPSEIYKADKSVKGPILGNAKEFAKTVSKEAEPGVESGVMGVVDFNDDVPF